MKNQSIFGSLTLLACGALAAGCVDSGQTGEEQDPIELDQSVTASLPASGSLRVQGDSVQILGDGWQAASPGIWQKGEHRIIMGAQGHQKAVADAEQSLAAARAGGSADLIRQNELNLQSLQTAAAASKKETDPSQQATCNINFILGPSGPIFGVVGVVGATEISCSVGTQVFTTQSQACSDLGCSPVVTYTNTVGLTPWLSGVIQPGTAGAACVSVTIPTPPGTGFQWNGPCG